MEKPRRAVFLDRDGVLNRARIEHNRPFAARTIEEIEILPGVKDACQALHEKDLVLIGVTNQPEIARGTLRLEAAQTMNELVRMKTGLDDLAMCPHDDADQCACRKPKPGLLQNAAKKWNLDLAHSFLVGDRWRDIEAGRAAGCRTVFIDYHYDEKMPVADHTADSLLAATPWIIQTLGGMT